MLARTTRPRAESDRADCRGDFRAVPARGDCGWGWKGNSPDRTSRHTTRAPGRPFRAPHTNSHREDSDRAVLGLRFAPRGRHARNRGERVSRASCRYTTSAIRRWSKRSVRRRHPHTGRSRASTYPPRGTGVPPDRERRTPTELRWATGLRPTGSRRPRASAKRGRSRDLLGICGGRATCIRRSKYAGLNLSRAVGVVYNGATTG